MKVISIHANGIGELEDALGTALAEGWRPTLALVFCSVIHDRELLTALFDRQGIRVFGATTGGEINDDHSGTRSISALLMDMNPAYFDILYGEYGGTGAVALATELAQKARARFARPALLVSFSINDPADMDQGEAMLQAIVKATGDETQVWGGGAGDDMAFRETFVFTNGHSGNQAILLLALNSDYVTVKGHAATGMKPAGTEKIVTKADGKWIREIDHMPAAEFIPRFVGITLHPEDYKDFSIQDIYMGLYRGGGEPVIRSAMGFNRENKAIAVSGSVCEGDRIRLMMPPDFEVIDELHEQTKKFREEEMPEADALVMFSCIGRLGVLGPLVDEELKGVRSVYNVPMAGLFSYGEYGRASGGNNEFHNMTCCWVALKEK